MSLKPESMFSRVKAGSGVVALDGKVASEVSPLMPLSQGRALIL